MVVKRIQRTCWSGMEELESRLAAMSLVRSKLLLTFLSAFGDEQPVSLPDERRAPSAIRRRPGPSVANNCDVPAASKDLKQPLIQLFAFRLQHNPVLWHRPKVSAQRR